MVIFFSKTTLVTKTGEYLDHGQKVSCFSFVVVVFFFKLAASVAWLLPSPTGKRLFLDTSVCVDEFADNEQDAVC